MKNRAIFTICSNNYLHFAYTLIDSLKKAGDGSDWYILLVDRPPSPGDTPPVPPPCPIIPVETIGIPSLNQMLFRYTITEANTAVKPFFIQWLFKKEYEKVIYLDPDIYVYRPLEDLFDLLDNQDILLIPHLTDSIEDDKKPGELDIIQAGTYNLGFIAVKNTPNVEKLLNWWAPKLINNCVIKVSDGVFVDQKWMDLAPGMFERVHILRDAGYNVAYWNLSHRPLTIERNQPLVRGRPLVFFHYSGLNPRYPRHLSRHQNRYRLSDLGAVKKLVQDYIQALKANGLRRFSSCQYAFNLFSDGTPVSDLFRHLYRTNPELAEKMGENPFDNKAVLYSFLNQPADHKQSPLISNFAEAACRFRPDLFDTSPNFRGNNGLQNFNRFRERACREFGVEKERIIPIKENGKGVERSSPRGIFDRIGYRAGYYIYQLAYKYKDHRYFYRVSPNARQKIKRGLLKTSSLLLKLPRTPVHYPSSSLPGNGVNVAAYVSANLGLGEAGRMVIKSLQSCRVNTRVIDCSREEKTELIKNDLPTNDDFDYKASIFAVNADRTLWAYGVYRPRFKGRHYIVGFWNWELPEWPDRWSPSFDCVDEVWVPSSFCQEAIARKSPVPVVKMPYCIDPAGMDADKGVGRSCFSLPEDRFIFLNMFDIRSFIERKNPLGVIEAFKAAFPASHRGVCLVIKINNSSARASSLNLIKESIRNHPNIMIIDKALDKRNLNTLVSLADCYVSLHRSEGFGFPLAEAMYLKKPVIATAWSGNVDFMNQQNSFPVGYRLTEIREDIGPYHKGQVWAEPDLSEASDYMAGIYADHEVGSLVGEQAHQYISTHLSPTRVGRTYIQRLKQVGALEGEYPV